MVHTSVSTESGQPLQLVEGFRKIVTSPSGPTHGHGRDAPHARPDVDFRGRSDGWWTLSWWRRPTDDTPPLEWLTHPVANKALTVFSFIGASYNTPYGVYPPNRARLKVDGKRDLTFDLGVRTRMVWQSGELQLEFAPKRVQMPADGYHRQHEMYGNSGIYRLTVPVALVTAGRPVRLRVDLEPPTDETVSFFMIKDRQDSIEVSTRTNGEQIAQLQEDVTQLRRTINALVKRQYPELSPDLVPSTEMVLYQDGRNHVNDLDITLTDDGEVMLTFRQAAEHVAPNGKTVLLRSREGGRTWLHDDSQVIAEFPWPVDPRGHTFHRLGDGRWLLSVLTFRNSDESGERRQPLASRRDYQTWLLRSADDGLTWVMDDREFDPGPLTDVTVFSPAVRLPSGRLLLPVASCLSEPPSASVFASDDDGASWEFMSMIGEVPLGYSATFPETTVARAESGRLEAIIRVNRGNYLQASSEDDGESWSPWRETPMPCFGTRGRLASLSDGNMLFSYAWRCRREDGLDDLGAVKLALSRDGGRTWDSADMRTLRDDFLNWDMGYPVTVELPNRQLFTVYWGNQMERFFIGGNFYEKWW